MSEPMLSDPTMLRIIAHYLRSLESRCSRVLMCAGVLDRMAESIQIVQDDHDASRRELNAVEAVVQDVLRDLPTWLTSSHGIHL